MRLVFQATSEALVRIWLDESSGAKTNCLICIVCIDVRVELDPQKHLITHGCNDIRLILKFGSFVVLLDLLNISNFKIFYSNK